MTRVWVFAVVLSSLVCSATQTSAQWYAAVDFVTPIRIDSSGTVFQREEAEVIIGNVPTGDYVVAAEPLLDGGDLGLDFTSAGRLTLGWRGEEFGIEGSYLRTDEWNAAATAFDPAGRMASPFSQVGADVNPLVDDNFSASVACASDLESAELHLTRVIYSDTLTDVMLLCGVRYMSIRESLVFRQQSGVASYEVLTGVDNFLLGPQLGVASQSPLPGGLLSIATKGALTANSIDKDTDFNGIAGQGVDTAAALIGELEVAYNFAPADNVVIRAGYQLVGVSDVALATDNFETSPTVLSSGQAYVQRAGLAYHAPFVGVVFVR
jgi:hypothetical protein